MAARVRGILERLLGRPLDAAMSEVVTDSELLRRFTGTRDEAAFELLVWRYGAMVLGVCRRAVCDEHLAEDAFQAVFLVLARKASSIRGGNVGGWLFRVARRVGARVARRVGARAARQRLTSHQLPEVPTSPQPSAAERQELAQLLDAEVARLPDRLRRAVVLCYLGGYTTEDAARELGCPRGTVLSRLATARKRLAERLTRRGVTLPAAVPLVGVGVDRGLVSAAVAEVPTFLSGNARLGSAAAVLAEGVIRTMTRGTLVTALAGVLFAAALATGVGWVAAQTSTKGDQPATTRSVPPQVQPDRARGDRPAAPAPDSDDEKRRDQAHAKLVEMSRELEAKIDLLEAKIATVRDQAATESRDAAVRLRTTQSDYDLERELALEDLRDAAAQLRAVRRQLADSDLRPPMQAPSVERLKERLDVAVKEVDRRKAELKQLDTNYGPMIEELRRTIAKSEQQAAGLVRKLDSERAVAQESLARVRGQIEVLKAQQAGVLLHPAAGVEAKLDALIRELVELRKELHQLKKGK